MSNVAEESRLETEIVKALGTMDELIKGQVQTGKGNEPDSWHGGDKEDLDDEAEKTEENGTNYKSGMKKGMDYSDKDMKKHGKEYKETMGDDDKEMMGDNDENYEKDMDKSVQSGVEVSVFLNELTKSVSEYCDGLSTYVTHAISQVHEGHGVVLKGLSSNLVAINDHIQKSQENITKFAEEPARGPKSVDVLSKSLDDSDSTPTYEKSVVLDALMKGFEDGTVSHLEVIKCEHLGVGAVNPDILKSLNIH